MLHNLNTGNFLVLYLNFYHGKEKFILAYADIGTVRSGIKINRANVQRLWTEQQGRKEKTGTDRHGCRQQQGIALFTFPFIRSPPT